MSNKVSNPVFNPSKIVAVGIYAFMSIIGSALILLLICAIYTNLNANIDYNSLYELLADSNKLEAANESLKKAYSIVASLGNMIAYLIMLILIGFYLRNYIKDDTIKTKNNIKIYSWLFPVLAISFSAITTVIDYYLIKPFVGSSNNQLSIESMINGGGAFFTFVAVVICAPIVEELIFRKTIFKALEKKPIIYSYLISIVIFSTLHMVSTNSNPLAWFLQLIPYAFSATLLCLIYDKTKGNIYASWFVHFINNLISFIFIYFHIFQ